MELRRYVRLNGQYIHIPEEVSCVDESCDYFVYQDQVIHKGDLVTQEEVDQK